MRRKRAGKGLGVYQSKAKRRKSNIQKEKKNQDDESTLAYSEKKSNSIKYNVHDNNNDIVMMDDELNEILDRISTISKEYMTSVGTEYSEDDYVQLMYKQDVQRETEQLMDSIKDYVHKKECNPKETWNNNEETNIDVNILEETHDYSTCHCHVPQHLQYAVDLIELKAVLVPVIKDMYKHKVLDDFIGLLDVIGSGKLDSNNIPLRLAVERAKLQQCETTTAMIYSPETIDFWNVFSRTCHGAGLQLMSGRKNSGQVCTRQTDPGHYDPLKGSFNFAVPDVKTLRRHQTKVEKYMYSGILHGSFDLIDKMKQYVLEYDAKRISKGLGEEGIGDVNLWGYEGPPNLQQSKAQLQKEVKLIEQLQEFEETQDDTLYPLLREMVTNVSRRIQKKRLSVLGHQKYLRELEQMCNGKPKLAKKYNKASQDTKANIYLLNNWIADALQLCKNICYIMSNINENNNVFACGTEIDLKKQSNLKILRQPETFSNKVNLDIHTHVVKQRTQKWMELRKQSNVTGSSMYRSLGLDTLKCQKEHYNEFILGNAPKPFTEEVQKRIDHGVENEVNSIIH